ncbi:MAG: L-threonylcarbamoyladenylate synthase [bacterium]|nr:L-threonylcarbamoyladenylate synthase [bacterium]
MENMWDNRKLINTLMDGKVVVMPTDTIYGIVGGALAPETVKRIYKIRQRSENKPCIILISNMEDLNKFNITISKEQKEKLNEYKDKPTSFILDCMEDKFIYLHKNTNTLAFRLPNNINLQNMLKITGPLIAPSANTEGNPPAKNIKEAQEYFDNKVDLYIDGGEMPVESSRIIRLSLDGSVSTIRE